MTYQPTYLILDEDREHLADGSLKEVAFALASHDDEAERIEFQPEGYPYAVYTGYVSVLEPTRIAIRALTASEIAKIESHAGEYLADFEHEREAERLGMAMERAAYERAVL